DAMAGAGGWSLRPGREPFFPQFLMTLPCLSNLTMRDLVFPQCPSATKMSPLGATSTADGALNSSGPLPAIPALPSVSSTLPSGLNDLMTLAVLAQPIGDPDVALAVDMDAVRQHQRTNAEAVHQLA